MSYYYYYYYIIPLRDIGPEESQTTVSVDKKYFDYGQNK